MLGVIGGNLLSVPLLSQTAQVYGVGALAVPVWVDVAVPLVMLGLAGAAAVLLALRAGRMSAVQAIATGRAPRPKHGYAAHRVLGRGPWARLPRSVTIGLAGPFARPTRTAITLAAILFGGDRGDVRRGPGHVAEPGLQRPVALGNRAGAGEHPGRARAERRSAVR